MINKVILVGNLGKDPEIRHSADGGAVVSITLATSKKWKSKTGEQKEQTEWHRVVFFGKLAEIAGKYLTKGAKAYIEGSIKYEQYADKKTGEIKYSTAIIADVMQMLGGKQEPKGNEESSEEQADFGGNDVPF